MNEHGLSESGEHESETDDDGKLPVQQNSASAQSHGCAQRGNPKTQTDKNKIKTHLTRPASLEMTYYRLDCSAFGPLDGGVRGRLGAGLFRLRGCPALSLAHGIIERTQHCHAARTLVRQPHQVLLHRKAVPVARRPQRQAPSSIAPYRPGRSSYLVGDTR